MAKVYDALKQVEAERSRQQRAAAEQVDDLLARLDAAERVVRGRVDELEVRLTASLEGRLVALERASTTATRQVLERLRREAEATNRRLNALIAIAAFVLLAALLR
jgi:hypothetical protein